MAKMKRPIGELVLGKLGTWFCNYKEQKLDPRSYFFTFSTP